MIRWRLVREIPRLRRQARQARTGRVRWPRLAHCVGHGLFVRGDEFLAWGGLPTETMNEDLAFGYLAVGADNINYPKPAPDLYQQTCRQLGVPCAGVIVLKDSLIGVQSALAARTTVFAIPDLPRTRPLAHRSFPQPHRSHPLARPRPHRSTQCYSWARAATGPPAASTTPPRPLPDT